MMCTFSVWYSARHRKASLEFLLTPSPGFKDKYMNLFSTQEILVIRQFWLIYPRDIVVLVENSCFVYFLLLVLVAYTAWTIGYKVSVISFVHPDWHQLLRRRTINHWIGSFFSCLGIETVEVDHHHTMDLEGFSLYWGRFGSS